MTNVDVEGCFLLGISWFSIRISKRVSLFACIEVRPYTVSSGFRNDRRGCMRKFKCCPYVLSSDLWDFEEGCLD